MHGSGMKNFPAAVSTSVYYSIMLVPVMVTPLIGCVLTVVGRRRATPVLCEQHGAGDGSGGQSADQGAP